MTSEISHILSYRRCLDSITVPQRGNDPGAGGEGLLLQRFMLLLQHHDERGQLVLVFLVLGRAVSAWSHVHDTLERFDFTA